jgi:hypothetical protein
MSGQAVGARSRGLGVPLRVSIRTTSTENGAHPPHTTPLFVLSSTICHHILLPSPSPTLLNLASSFLLSIVVGAPYRFHLKKFCKFVSTVWLSFVQKSHSKRAFRIIFLCSAMISRDSRF